MLTLNLVAPELKKELKHKHVFILIKKGANVLIFLSIFIALYASLGWAIIYNNYTSAVEQTSLNLEDSDSYDSVVNSINSQLTTIAEIQENHYPISQIFEKLMENITADISMTSVRVNRDNKIIEMQGQAVSRDGLLAFKEHLANTEMFDEINLPISNILQKDNISFEISAKLNLDADK